MPIATFVVGNVTPRVIEEIEALAGSVRQISEAPRLFFIELPYHSIASQSDDNRTLLEEGIQDTDIEIRIQGGQSSLLLHSAGWRCVYQPSPYAITYTSLRSLQGRILQRTVLGRVAYNHGNHLQERDQAVMLPEPGEPLPFHATLPISKNRSEQEGSMTGTLMMDAQKERLSRSHQAIVEHIRHTELSVYDRSLWALAHDPLTFSQRPDLREAFAAHITFSSYGSPAVREALTVIEEDLANSDEETARERIIALVNEHLAHAESLLFALSEEDEQAIREVELAHLLHAFRTGMLTDQERKQALGQFGDASYLQARTEVVQSLSHPLPALRTRALETLILAWGLFEYQEVAFQFLHDPDPGCREQGMRCLNPCGKRLDDLRILTSYAAIVANKEELPTLRMIAYAELLMACGVSIPDDAWQEFEDRVQEAGTLEQVPWIDWTLIAFFTETTDNQTRFQTTLKYTEDGDWKWWIDQHGRVFSSAEDLTNKVLLPAHHLAHTRLPHYQMTITFTPQESSETPREEASHPLIQHFWRARNGSIT